MRSDLTTLLPVSRIPSLFHIIDESIKVLDVTCNLSSNGRNGVAYCKNISALIQRGYPTVTFQMFHRQAFQGRSAVVSFFFLLRENLT